MADTDLLGERHFVSAELWADMQGDCGSIHLNGIGFQSSRWAKSDHEVYLHDHFSSGEGGAGHGVFGLANKRAWEESHADTCGREWWPVIGSHSFSSIIFAPTALNVPEIREELENLGDADTSEVEQEIADEAWDSYGRSELTRWLRDQVPDSFLDSAEWEDAVNNLAKEQIDSIWWTAVSEGSGEEVVIEGLGANFDIELAFQGRYVEEDVRARYTESDWGRLFAEYLAYECFGGAKTLLGIRVLALSAETKQALWDYFYDRTSRALTGGPAMAVDILRANSAFSQVLLLVKNWTDDTWAIFLDTVEEEGPDAFKPGHAGRRFGRR